MLLRASRGGAGLASAVLRKSSEASRQSFSLGKGLTGALD